MLPQCSHITRKRGVYYYRRRLPAPGLGEIAVSLQTRHYRCAEYLASLLDPVFARACAMSVLKSDITAILRQHLQEQLDADLQQHLAQRPGRGVYSPMLDDGDDPLRPDRLFVEERLHEAVLAKAGRDTDSVAGDVDALMQRHSLPEGRRQEVALGVLQTNVQFWQQAQKRLEGLADEISLSVTAPATVSATTAAPAVIDGPKLSEIVEDFVKKMQALGQWRGQSGKQALATYRIFTQWCGDKPLRGYTQADAGDFVELLCQLPADWSNGKRWKGMALAALVEAATGDTSVEKLTTKTIKRHVSALAKIYGYYMKRGEVPKPNLFHDLDLASYGRASALRMMWEGENLSRLFNSPIWRGRHHRFRSKPGTHIIKDSYFWLPILGLYHGNRLEEFAQLRRQDVKKIADIWVLHITVESGGQLKNAYLTRFLPLHPELLRLGFIEHVTENAPEPSSLVFPDLRAAGPDNKLGHDWSGEFTRYRQDIGVYAKGRDYHSFRHGVTTKLFDAGVSTGIVDELTGHEGEGESRSRYRTRGAARPEQSVPGLYEAICKVQWPEVDLSHLYVDAKNPS